MVPNRWNDGGRGILEGMRVLVVDDDESLRMALDALLRSAGARATVVGDAVTAVEHLEADGNQDVVLTDLQMPGPSGLWLAEWCVGHLPYVPVVVMSAGLPETGAIFPRSVWRYIRKPFAADSLLELLADAAPPPLP